MSEIKNLKYENGTEEIFTLTVVDSAFAGVYVIEMPDAFEQSDCIIDINEEFFNIDNFIIGDSEKISFLEYSNPIGFDIVKKVYNEKGCDGKILFGWKAKNGTNEYDLLGEGYELNLNKYKESYEKSMMKIETEIKKREVQNKFLTREDVSVNLFSEKDLDNLPCDPLVLEDVYFKEGVRKKSNFYYFDITQNLYNGPLLLITASSPVKTFQFVYIRSDDFELGDNENNASGYFFFYNYNWSSETWSISYIYRGSLLASLSDLPNVEIEISNLEVHALQYLANSDPNFSMNAVIKLNGNIVRRVKLEDFTMISPDVQFKRSEIKVLNKKYQIGNLKQNETVEILFETNDSNGAFFRTIDTSTSFEISADLTSPLRKTKVIRLKNAIERLSRLYSGVDLPVESIIISPGGYYYNTAISTGMFMRGLPDVYNTNKITTSFKELFYESASKLLALGFDLQDEKIIVEDIAYFFKDLETYDFSDKEFIQEDYNLENDVENSYNQLIFGSKKYSTNKRSDLLNYNTKLEALSPLKSVKTKFDKAINAIIDEDKISEMILDKSTSTNDNDDDLIMFDVVHVDNYEDEGILSDAVHYSEGGYLWINSYETPFDILPLFVGGFLEITSGLNTGNWEILVIDKYKIKLNRTSGIEAGTSETPIKFIVSDIDKNRTDEGFSIVDNVKDRKSATNLRHNPKYQMARWFPFYGSGLNKKLSSEEIIVTNYKNNGDVILNPNSTELNNELQGETTLKVNETLERLRDYRQPFFSGQTIEITLMEVKFNEFFKCYNQWRYGENNRGYISVGNVKLYPFGTKAFNFAGSLNELTLRGKIKFDVPIIE